MFGIKPHSYYVLYGHSTTRALFGYGGGGEQDAVAFHHDRLMLWAHVEEQCATLDLRDSSSRRYPGGIGKSAVTIKPVV